jgi:hypothetical protein
VRLEGLGKSRKMIDIIGSQTSDLPACGIVPRTITPLRAPHEQESGDKKQMNIKPLPYIADMHVQLQTYVQFTREI